MSKIKIGLDISHVKHFQRPVSLLKIFSMIKTQPFETHTVEYDEWFDNNKPIFESEAEALREALPFGDLHGIEVGLGTGRFSVALGIKEGIEPSFESRKIALKRGIEVMDAVAEDLPYKDLHFDFVLMACSINYFNDLPQAFLEAKRVLKPEGSIIVGFIDKDSIIGKIYETRKENKETTFYKQATFYSVDKVVSKLKQAGFHKMEISQTLFNPLEKINKFEATKPGYGEGSFVVIKALKK